MKNIDRVLLGVVVAYVALCPYTKVEESFNMQAMHDILFHNKDLHLYDHNEFPGVVPRTFIGSLLVSLLAAPFVSVANLLGLDKVASQVIVRVLLGTLCCLSFLRLKLAVRSVFGNQAAWLLVLLTATQFHLPFYMSRPLPNTFALAIVLLALAEWINKRLDRFIYLMVFAIAVFRSELVILLGSVMLWELICGNISMVKMIRLGIPVGVVSVLVSVAVDSVFWGRPLWPEGEVLFFNTVMNKSKEWGTSPFHWYFTSVLPRACTVALPFSVLALFLDSKVKHYLGPVALFVVLYSFLPHKELRFVVYAFPIINMAGAVGMSKLLHLNYGPRLSFIFRAAVAGAILVSCLASVFFVSLSRTNYPGGDALVLLNNNCGDACGTPDAPLAVHIGNLAAQTGVSRFTQANAGFAYSKAEQWTEDVRPDMFHWLVEEVKDRDLFANTHDVQFEVEGFDSVALKPSWPFVSIRNAVKLVIMRRKDLAENSE